MPALRILIVLSATTLVCVADNGPAPLEVIGDLTLAGVTKSVTITLQGRWDCTQVQVVGSLPIAFSDYNITAPTAPAVASVDDNGEMELQLFFKKSG